MDRSRAAPARWREALMLALGIASAALLAGAALAPFSDPELVGRATFAQLAGSVEDGIAAEWERLLAERSIGGTPLGNWTAAEAARAGELPEETAPIQIEASLTAFDVLLGEAQRLEASGDRSEALATALEALDKQAPPARRGLARLVAIRVARALEDCATADSQWTEASGELEGSEASGGMPMLVACALAAAPCLQGDDRAAAQGRIVEAWIVGDLALGDGPLRDVLSERVEQMAPRSEATRRLRSYERARGLAVLAGTLPGRTLPPRPSDGRWHLSSYVRVHGLVAWRAEGADSVVACRLTPVELAATLRARVDLSELLPPGFRLDFEQDEEVEGQPVRDRRDLAEGKLGFVLRHTDPEAAMRAEGGRLALLRFALLVLAVLTVGASLATFRALRRSRRLAEMKSAFVANVSHELRTPLASILMLSENLETGRVSDEPGRARYHALIRREAERLRRLVADVLDFSRLERGKPLEMRRDPVELTGFMDALGEEAQGWAQRHEVELEVEVGECPGRALLDTDAVRRAVVNLLDNARKHSGCRAVVLSARAGHGDLALVVQDQGRGVPEAARRDVFEPFARVEGENGAAGAGLGLAIVREIARAHGGDVTLSTPSSGVGARFEIRIPLESQDAGRELET